MYVMYYDVSDIGRICDIITKMMILVVTLRNQIRLIKGVVIIGQGTDPAKSHSSGEPAGSFECHHSAN